MPVTSCLFQFAYWRGSPRAGVRPSFPLARRRGARRDASVHASRAAGRRRVRSGEAGDRRSTSAPASSRHPWVDHYRRWRRGWQCRDGNASSRELLWPHHYAECRCSCTLPNDRMVRQRQKHTVLKSVHTPPASESPRGIIRRAESRRELEKSIDGRRSRRFNEISTVSAPSLGCKTFDI